MDRRTRGGAAKRRKRIGLRAPNAAHRIRTAVLFVVGVKNEEYCQRALQHRIGLIRQLRRLEHHIEEVAFIAQIVVRIPVLHAERLR